MSEEKKTGAATSYLDAIANLKLEIITVYPEPGIAMKRIKPTAFGAIFDVGDLPMDAAGMASASWAEQGVGALPDSTDDSPDAGAAEKAQVEALKKALEVRDRVFSNSVEPKIVNHPPTNDNEIHWKQIPPAHLEYLYKYEASFGSAAIMAAMFPEEPGQGAYLGSHSKKRRRPRK